MSLNFKTDNYIPHTIINATVVRTSDLKIYLHSWGPHLLGLKSSHKTILHQDIHCPEIIPHRKESIECPFQTIMKCDVDIRRDLYINIVLSGGAWLRSCSFHHVDQGRCSSWAKVLGCSIFGFFVHFLTNVDLQDRIWWIRSIYRPLSLRPSFVLNKPPLTVQ